MTNEERRQRITELEKQIWKLQSEVSDIKADCAHEFVRTEWETRQCNGVCGLVGGWWCDVSPDNVCHYFTNEEGAIELSDGRLIAPPEDHDYKCENDDYCIFCGEPDERK